jgi:AAA+ ATPase superfamily predicted ATPase
MEFIRDKPAVFFTARETTAAENLVLLSDAVQDSALGIAPVFRSFDDALDRLFLAAENKRLVFVIDEYPYLAEAWRGISSVLQEKIDHRKANCKLFLVLCGSSMSFMEHQVLGYKSPLYGRRTGQIKLEPFDFFESRKFFPALNPLDAAVIYSVTGGIPSYLERFKGKASLRQKIIDNFLTPTGFLFEEPGNLLKQELRTPSNYNAVIREIAGGRTKVSEIASAAGFETGTLSHLLATLLELGIAERETPVTEKNKRSRRSLYQIRDGLFRFWYRFIPGLIDIIQHGNTLKAWETIQENMEAFMGRAFETICLQYLWRENNAERLPFFFDAAGRWWGNDPLRREEAEIDIMALGGKTHALFCECKWRNRETAKETLEGLMRKAEHFAFGRKYFYVFSKSSFSSGCVKAAKALGNVRLVSFKEMTK